MAIATYRASPTVTKHLCYVCHEQTLDALSPENFRANNRMGDDEGYWMFTLNIERCALHWPTVLERVAAFPCGIPTSQEIDVCLTVQEYGRAQQAATVGPVADAPSKVHNGNIQLANMRYHDITGDHMKEDALFKTARAEIWPLLATIITSDSADDVLNSGCCCARNCFDGRTGCRLVKRRFIYNANYVRSKRIEEPKVTVLNEAGELLPYVYPCYDAGNEDKVNELTDVIAVRYGPSTVDKLFYANTTANIQLAIEKRITEKHVPMTLTDYDRETLMFATQILVDEIINNPHIDNIAMWVGFAALKSAKWTMERAMNALTTLMQTYMPNYQFSGAIKLEPMAAGKPPRMLIADGDYGAVMSCFVIGVLERFICQYHKSQTIKGACKNERMRQICEAARYIFPSGSEAGMAIRAFIMENDGSAWDTCCSLELRNLTENPVIEALFDRLAKYVVCYNHFQEPRKTANRKPKIKLATQPGKMRFEQVQNPKFTEVSDIQVLKKRVLVIIESIRRSGDRGTSILNWIINKICWTWVLCGPNAFEMMRKDSKKIRDIFGTVRRFLMWLEGDDSMLWLSGRPFTEAELKVLEARWASLGHRPKLFQRTEGDVAEFCGWKIPVDGFGLVWDGAVPDVPRLLSNCFYSHSKEAVTAAVTGDAIAFGRAVGPALISRASSIADKVPSIARWLAEQACELSPNIVDELFSRDAMFRMETVQAAELLPDWYKGDDPNRILDQRYESFVDNVHRRVQNSISAGGLMDEANLAIQHGWVTSVNEWCTFVDRLGAITRASPQDAYRAIVPPGMM